MPPLVVCLTTLEGVLLVLCPAVKTALTASADVPDLPRSLQMKASRSNLVYLCPNHIQGRHKLQAVNCLHCSQVLRAAFFMQNVCCAYIIL